MGRRVAKPEQPEEHDEPRWQSRPPLSRAAIARIVQLVGLFNVLTAIAPTRHGRMAALSEFIPVAGILSARADIAVAGPC